MSELMQAAAKRRYDAILFDDGHLLPVIDGVPIVYEDEPPMEDKARSFKETSAGKTDQSVTEEELAPMERNCI
jgi:hypothetical protein